MTPDEFQLLAAFIVGTHWRTRIGPMIGKGRNQVWVYATGKQAVPVTVQLLLRQMAKEELDAARRAGRRCPAVPPVVQSFQD